MLGVVIAQTHLRLVKVLLYVDLFSAFLLFRFKTCELGLDLLRDKALLKNIISLTLERHRLLPFKVGIGK
jgi:hypothetical protein